MASINVEMRVVGVPVVNPSRSTKQDQGEGLLRTRRLRAKMRCREDVDWRRSWGRASGRQDGEDEEDWRYEVRIQGEARRMWKRRWGRMNRMKE